MKYLAAALILVAMAVTWRLSSTTREFGLEQHKSLEDQVQAMIRSAVKEKRPAATDVSFQQIFTETIKPNEEIRARFRYQIIEPATGGEITSQMIEGVSTLLSRDGGRSWNWSGENVKAPALEFQKGSRVGPEAAKLPEVAAPPTEAEAPAR
jgi:hypothetical protein